MKERLEDYVIVIMIVAVMILLMWKAHNENSRIVEEETVQIETETETVYYDEPDITTVAAPLMLMGNEHLFERTTETEVETITEVETTTEYIPETTVEEIVTEEETTVDRLWLMSNEIEHIIATSTMDWFIQFKNIIAKYPDVSPYVSIYEKYSDWEIDTMMRVVYCEIGSGSFEQMCNIAQVILNRVHNPYFPNTLGDVLLSPQQFTPVLTGWYQTVTPSEAVKLACEYVAMFYTVGDTVFFDTNGRGNEYGTFRFFDGLIYYYGLREGL